MFPPQVFSLSLYELDQMFVVFVRIAEALEKGSGIN
jgi:hypothetical protein